MEENKRVCKKCGEEKDIGEFSTRIYKDKLIHNGKCKACEFDRARKYREKNSKIISEKNKIKRANDPLHKEKERKQRKKHKEQRAGYNKKYTEEHKEERSAYAKRYREEHKEEVSKKRRAKYNANIEENRKICLGYYYKNKKEIRARRKERHKERMKIDIDYRLRHTLRRRFNLLIEKGLVIKDDDSVIDLIGCSIDFLIKYLESLWQPGMNWENHGLHGWHIDHIKPLVIFDLKNKEQLNQAWHYTNLQPLWALENFSKGAKYQEQEISNV